MDKPVYLCGDGYDITLEMLTHPTCPTPVSQRNQSAYSVAQIARQQFLSGERTTDVALAPTYLRLSQAERERAEKQNNLNI